jgi:hypothetical protein
MKRIITLVILSLVTLSSQAFSLFDNDSKQHYTETKYPIVLAMFPLVVAILKGK